MPEYDDTKFVYIFLRKDLEKINPLYPAIQLGHATYELGRMLSPRRVGEPPDSFCVFEVADEEDLLEVEEYVRRNLKLYCHTFVERDHDTGFTALAVQPIQGQFREHFRMFKPYRARKTFWEKLKAVFAT